LTNWPVLGSRGGVLCVVDFVVADVPVIEPPFEPAIAGAGLALMNWPVLGSRGGVLCVDIDFVVDAPVIEPPLAPAAGAGLGLALTNLPVLGSRGGVLCVVDLGDAVGLGFVVEVVVILEVGLGAAGVGA